MSPNDLTLIEAIDLLAKRGFRVIRRSGAGTPFLQLLHSQFEGSSRQARNHRRQPSNARGLRLRLT